MIWLLSFALQIAFIVAGIRRDERSGLWSWSLFFFAIGFAAVEILLVVLPALSVELHNRWFWWIYGAAWVIAALNFVWFIIVCRRWKLPGGRTRVETEHGG